MKFIRHLLAFGGLSVASAQGNVWVVSDSACTAADFTDLQPAIDAASDGDAILAHAGSYSSCVIDGKSLVIVGLPGAMVESFPVTTVVKIQNLGPHQSVLWQGIDVLLSEFFIFGAQQNSFEITSSDGVVWIEDAYVRGIAGVSTTLSDVVITDCGLQGDTASFFSGGTFNFDGLYSEASTVYLYESTLVGGHGQGGSCHLLSCTNPVDSGTGATVHSGLLFASGCDFIGGTGGAATPFGECGQFGGEFSCSGHGASGGDGADFFGGAPEILDCSFVAGAGGAGDPECSCQDGSDGVELVGPATLLSGTARALALDSPVTESTTVPLTFEGVSGDVASLLISPESAQATYPEAIGPLALGPWASSPVGRVPGTGELADELEIGALPPGVEFQVWYTQPLFETTGGELYLGAPAALVVFDEEFMLAGGSVVPYGCGVNPEGSLVLLDGTPQIGTTFRLGVHNPHFTQPFFSASFVAVSTEPDPAFPCGTSLPGYGMAAPGAPGELLVSLGAPFELILGDPWILLGPAEVEFNIPAQCSLIGQSLYAQGALVDPFGTSGIDIGLAGAVELRVEL